VRGPARRGPWPGAQSRVPRSASRPAWSTASARASSSSAPASPGCTPPGARRARRRRGGDVLLTKRTLFDSATAYAQGGIAAALGAGDTPALHRADTLAAGAALCDADAVQVLVEEGPDRVRELYAAGAAFDRTDDGATSSSAARPRTRRAASSTRAATRPAPRWRARSSSACAASPRVRVLEQARVLDLVVDGEGARRCCAGVRASVAGRAVEITADATVLAAGGCGQVYRYTTNPQVATGDGYAIAWRAGARLTDMEFVQFHPTALDTPENPLALVSEAVRGEGATLVNARGERFMPARHRSPSWRRATSSRARSSASSSGTGACTSTRGSSPAAAASPSASRDHGALPGARHRPGRDRIPVTPAAHYMMGGVTTDLAGRSTLGRLYACGEVARTGVHGANRLASNSLLEGLVFAERVARAVRDEAPLPAAPRRRSPWEVPPLADRGAAQVAADAIRTTMWQHAAIDRSAEGLARCLADLAHIGARLTPGMTEERNLLDTARLVAEAALLRTESRGGHYRSDFPKPRAEWRGRHIEW
jgi:L-aspartate oxidase